jgi:osmotically-inducible protein OsmY
MKRYAILATLAILALSFVIARAASQQNPVAQDQSQPPQQTEKPPHVDTEPDPAARNLEKNILDAIKQDPHMAYSRVTVHVTESEVVLTGVVLTNTAKDQAAQIATDHAGGRKVTNRIKVNPNTHPGPGI